MTLDCKPRRMYPSALETQTPTKFSSTQNIRTRNPISQQMNQSHSLSKRTGRRESTGESFLQRLLEIERRHDEKRMYRQNRVTKNNVESGVFDEGAAFHRSPTRWLSEQIFDDTQDTSSLNDDARDYFNKKPQPLYTSAFCRLPNISDVHVISSNSNCTAASPSSLYLQTNKQTDSEYQIDSLSSLSYVELQPSDDSSTQSTILRKRPLRLPPIFLPPVYTVRPRPLKERDFLTPTHIRGPITDDEWEDLHQCRYIRPAPTGRFHVPLSSSQMSLL